MANRAFFSDNDGQFLEKRRTIYAVIDFGSSGTPTLKKWTPVSNGVAGSYADAPSVGTQGVASVTKDATGDFVLVLQDGYQRLLGLRGSFQVDATTGTPVAPAAPIVALVGGSSGKTNVTTTGSNAKTIEFGTFAATSSSVTTLTPTNPASGERLFLEIVLDDSGVAGG